MTNIDDQKDAAHERIVFGSSHDQKTDCWLFLRGVQAKTGIGTLKVNGQLRTASRVSAWVYIGGFDLDDRNVLVRRTCHNLACVNPEHLSIHFKYGGVRTYETDCKSSEPVSCVPDGRHGCADEGREADLA